MRHYVWADSDGCLRAYSSSSSGFSDGCDPSDPNTTHPHALNLRNRFICDLDLGLVAAYPYDCDCVPGKVCSCKTPCICSCTCGGLCVSNHYIDNGILVSKPSIVMRVNDAIRDCTKVPLDSPPGTAISVRLEGQVPDGHQLTLSRYGATVAQKDPQLTFSNGVTNTVVLRSPAQGVTGGVNGASKYVTSALLILRGWAD